MHFKWNVPDIHGPDEQSELATGESIRKFYNHRKLKKQSRTKRQGFALEVDANAFIKK